MNTDTNTASSRVKELERKILWRNRLSFLVCLTPLFAVGLLFFLIKGPLEIGAWGLAICAFTITIVSWEVVGVDASNFLFGADFVAEAKRYGEIKQKIRRETAWQEEKERKMKEAREFDQLETDMRAAWGLKERP